MNFRETPARRAIAVIVNSCLRAFASARPRHPRQHIRWRRQHEQTPVTEHDATAIQGHTAKRSADGIKRSHTSSWRRSAWASARKASHTLPAGVRAARLTRSASTPRRSTSSQGASRTRSHHPRLASRLTGRLTWSGPHDRLGDHDRVTLAPRRARLPDPRKATRRAGLPAWGAQQLLLAVPEGRAARSARVDPDTWRRRAFQPVEDLPRPRKTTLQARRPGADTSPTRALACYSGEARDAASPNTATAPILAATPSRPSRRRASPNQDTAAGHPLAGHWSTHGNTKGTATPSCGGWGRATPLSLACLERRSSRRRPRPQGGR
jgi:hypothetical protein